MPNQYWWYPCCLFIVITSYHSALAVITLINLVFPVYFLECKPFIDWTWCWKRSCRFHFSFRSFDSLYYILRVYFTPWSPSLLFLSPFLFCMPFLWADSEPVVSFWKGNDAGVLILWMRAAQCNDPALYCLPHTNPRAGGVKWHLQGGVCVCVWAHACAQAAHPHETNSTIKNDQRNYCTVLQWATLHCVAKCTDCSPYSTHWHTYTLTWIPIVVFPEICMLSEIRCVHMFCLNLPEAFQAAQEIALMLPL